MSPKKQQASNRVEGLPIGPVAARSSSKARKVRIIALALFLISCIAAYIVISSTPTQPTEVISEMVSVGSG